MSNINRITVRENQIQDIYYTSFKKLYKCLFKHIKENTSIETYKIYRKKYSEFETINRTITDYYEYIEKKHEGVRSDVHYSKELTYKIKNKKFDANSLKAVKSIERDLRIGAGIEKYLSTKAIKGTKDGLFNDWGILHCHLSTLVDSNLKGLVKRTKDILLLKLCGNNAYFIDIVPHGKGYGDLWYEKNMLEIIYRNWKNLILICNSELEIHTDYSEKDIKRIRRDGHSYIFNIKPYDACINIVPGGLTSSGHSIRIVKKEYEILRILRSELYYLLGEIYTHKNINYPFFIDVNYIYPHIYVKVSMPEIKIETIICLVSFKLRSIVATLVRGKIMLDIQ